MQLIHHLRIVQMLREDGVGEPINPMPATDKMYAVVTEEWFNRSFTDAFRSAFSSLGLPGNSGTESWDCDDAALFIRAYSRVLHYRTSGRKDYSIAIGEFHYLPDGQNTPHAINFAITDGGIIYYDPQLWKAVTLSTMEKKLCYAYLF